MNIQCLAKKQGLLTKEIFPPIIAQVQPYIDGNVAAEDEFANHHQVLRRPQVLVAIEKASIRNNVGIVELPDGQIVYEGKCLFHFNVFMLYLKVMQPLRICDCLQKYLNLR